MEQGQGSPREPGGTQSQKGSRSTPAWWSGPVRLRAKLNGVIPITPDSL